jgi:hypothetical protein
MASDINPDTINSSYPVAGQDNSTQGFRDNFTAIKTNFAYAEGEINDLQSKVLLKSALAGEPLNNNLNDSLLYAARVQDFSWTKITTASNIGPITLNYGSGHYQSLGTLAGSVSLNVINWPTVGSWGWLRFQVIIDNINHSVTLPTGTTVNSTGVQGYDASTRIISFAATGVYEFVLETYTGGSTITLQDTNKQIQPFNNSSEDLAASAAANLGVTASYFSTAAPETASLAAGVEGQIKTFAMYATSGNMVITVANAGWKTSGTGTMTFDTIGDACTLQYINGKWFCIGNNGATFA